MVQSNSVSVAPDQQICAVVFGNLRLEEDGTLSRADEIVHLPPKELAALKLLLAHAGQIVTHRQLRHAIWGDVHVTDDSVPKCVSSLRELLKPDDCIQTVYKRGYRLSVEVQKREPETPEERQRLVIMPFAVDANVPGYLGPAIAEETIALLTADQLVPIHVLARDSAFSLAARGMTAHQVGEALEADQVLTGTLRSMASHYRLRAEMIRVADGTQIWVEDMLVPQARATGLETELANRLFVRLSAHDWFVSQRAGQKNTAESFKVREAYELFLRGHHEWQTLQRHRMQDGVQHLSRAIELDPSAHATQIDLANACVTQTFSGFVSPMQAAELIRQTADSIRASAEGTEAILPPLGWIRFHVDHDLPGALRAFAASAHLPHETSITRLRSMLALSRHRFEEAIEIIDDALHIDPYSPWLNARLAWAFHLAGEPSKSVTQVEHTLELFPDHESSNVYGAIILAFNGKTDSAVAVAENLVRRSPHFDLGVAVYAYALAQNSRTDEAHSILERLQWLSRERFVLSSFTPAVSLALGDPDGAIADLEEAAEARCPWLFQMLADPRLEAIHTHPKFLKILAILERMEDAAFRKVDHDDQAARHFRDSSK